MRSRCLAVLASLALVSGLAFSGVAPEAAQAAVPSNSITAVAPNNGELKPPPSGKGVVGKDKSKKLQGPRSMPPRPDSVSARTLTPCAPSTCLNIAGVDQFLTDRATGYAVYTTVHNPYVATSSNNKMGQSDTFSSVSAIGSFVSGVNENNAQIGWMVNPSMYGDSATHLFVSATSNGVFLGYDMAAGAGFVDLSGGTGFSPVGPGDDISSWVGTSKRLIVQYVDSAGSAGRPGLWVSANNLWVGYFPSGTTYSGTTFVEMDLVRTYGVVAGSKNESCSDMGNGALASSSAGAQLTNYTLFGTTDTPDIAQQGGATEATKWNKVNVGSPVTQVNIGGPGYNSAGTAIGATGSCGDTAEGVPCDRSIQMWQSHAPDNPVTYPTLGGTGSQNMVCYSRASLVIGTCYTPLNQGVRPINALWNNSLQSGYTVKWYTNATCTAGSEITLGNGQKTALNFGGSYDDFKILRFKRTA